MTDDFHLSPITGKEACRRICFVGLICLRTFSLVLLSFIPIRTSWRWMLLYGWFDPKVLRHFRCKQTVSNAYPIKIIHAFLISHLLNLIKSLQNTRNERPTIISCTKSDEEPVLYTRRSSIKPCKMVSGRRLQSIGIYYGFPLGISFVYLGNK